MRGLRQGVRVRVGVGVEVGGGVKGWWEAVFSFFFFNR